MVICDKLPATKDDKGLVDSRIFIRNNVPAGLNVFLTILKRLIVINFPVEVCVYETIQSSEDG